MWQWLKKLLNVSTPRVEEVRVAELKTTLNPDYNWPTDTTKQFRIDYVNLRELPQLGQRRVEQFQKVQVAVDRARVAAIDGTMRGKLDASAPEMPTRKAASPVEIPKLTDTLERDRQELKRIVQRVAQRHKVVQRGIDSVQEDRRRREEEEESRRRRQRQDDDDAFTRNNLSASSWATSSNDTPSSSSSSHCSPSPSHSSSNYDHSSSHSCSSSSYDGGGGSSGGFE